MTISLNSGSPDRQRSEGAKADIHFLAARWNLRDPGYHFPGAAIGAAITHLLRRIFGCLTWRGCLSWRTCRVRRRRMGATVVVNGEWLQEPAPPATSHSSRLYRRIPHRQGAKRAKLRGQRPDVRSQRSAVTGRRSGRGSSRVPSMRTKENASRSGRPPEHPSLSVSP
jgi:hypothetical protein